MELEHPLCNKFVTDMERNADTLYTIKNAMTEPLEDELIY